MPAAHHEPHLKTYSDPLDLRSLAALRQCHASGSVAAAARALGWSHPTVDHHLAKLERQLGARLLERTPRGSRTTELGAVVAERAEEILGLCDRLVAEVHDSQLATTPVVRFAALPTLGALILPPVQRALRDLTDAPQLDVTIDELMPIVAGLEQGRIDVAILVATGRVPPISSSRVHLERLRSEPLHLCVARDHPLAISSPNELPRFEQLRDEQWAFGVDEHDPSDAGLKELFAAAGLKPRVGMRLDDYRTIQRLVGAGLTIALVPASALDADAPVHSWAFPETMLRRDVLLAVRTPIAPRGKVGTVAESRKQRALTQVVAEIRAAAR